MQLKTIFIIGILAVAGIGGFGVALLYLLGGGEKTSTQVPTQTPTSSYPNQSSVTVPMVQTQVDQPINLDLDLEGEYSALFGALGAQQIDFTPVSSTAGKFGSVYALYGADIATVKKLFPALSEFKINIALVDLNDDGTEEAVVFENLPGYCGSGGCPLDIYKKENDKWTPLFGAIVAGSVGVSNVYINGYASLFISVHGDIGYLTNVVRYVWDGKYYQPAETVARWNGQTFLRE